MNSLLERKLLYVTGKGGVGKTTVATALALAAARSGRRVILCEVGAQARVPRLFGRAVPSGDAAATEIAVDDGLWAVSVDPQHALEEWLATVLGSRRAVSLLSRSNAFGYFVAAAPGARELVTITKVWELSQTKRWDKRAAGYDLVVVDAPASGHGLAMLRTPGTFADIARVGPIAKQAGRVRELLADPRSSAVVAVAVPGEMPISETLSLAEQMPAITGRALEAVVVNGMLPKRFSKADEAEVGDAASSSVASAVHRAAGRTRDQAAQLARLRRGLDTTEVATLPFLFANELDADGVRSLSEKLERQLG